MQLLDGFLAFALTLAALATVVSVLVEVLHRVLRLRTKGLNQMLSAYFDHVVAPRLAAVAPVDAHGQAIPAQALKQDLLQTLVNSKIQSEIIGTWVGRKLHFLFGPLTAHTKVTTEEFLLRLPQTQAFQALAGRSQAQIEAALSELATKYDEYGSAISDYFKRRAQVVSIVVGVLLAVFANIDGLRIYQRFINDPVLREQVIQTLPAWENRAQTPPPAAAGTQTGAALGATAAATGTRATTPSSEVDAPLARVRSDLATLADLGLPIGWAHYPNCLKSEGEAAVPRCRAAAAQRASACVGEGACASVWSSVWATAAVDRGEFLTWLFAAIVTGVLIGLGGPFWFDIARKLSQLSSTLRGRGDGAQPAADATRSAAPDRDTLITRVAERAATSAPPAEPAKRRLLA